MKNNIFRTHTFLILLFVFGCQKSERKVPSEIKPTEEPAITGVAAAYLPNLDDPKVKKTFSHSTYTEIKDPQLAAHEGLFIEIDFFQTTARAPDVSEESVLFDAETSEYDFFYLNGNFKTFSRDPDRQKFQGNFFIRTRSSNKGNIKSALFKIEEVSGLNDQKFAIRDRSHIYHIFQYPCLKHPDSCRYHFIENGVSKIFPTYDYFYFSYLLAKKFPILNEEVIENPDLKGVLTSDTVLDVDQFVSMRGQYLSILFDTWKDQSLVEELKFYSTSDFSGAPAFVIRSNSIKMADNRQCYWSAEKKDWILNRNEGKEIFELCPVQPIVRLKDLSTRAADYVEYYVKYDLIDPELKFLTIKLSNSQYYMDLSPCSQKKAFCNFKYFPKTRYDNVILKRDKTIKHKSLQALNELIKGLKSCLTNKDEKCIQKYFVKPEDILSSDPEEDIVNMTVSVPGYNFSMEDFEELKACLDYQNLLPNLLGSKGKDKFCAFAPREILNATSKNQSKFLFIGKLEDMKRDYSEYHLDLSNEKWEQIPYTNIEYEALMNE